MTHLTRACVPNKCFHKGELRQKKQKKETPAVSLSFYLQKAPDWNFPRVEQCVNALLCHLFGEQTLFCKRVKLGVAVVVVQSLSLALNCIGQRIDTCFFAACDICCTRVNYRFSFVSAFDQSEKKTRVRVIKNTPTS